MPNVLHLRTRTGHIDDDYRRWLRNRYTMLWSTATRDAEASCPVCKTIIIWRLRDISREVCCTDHLPDWRLGVRLLDELLYDTELLSCDATDPVIGGVLMPNHKEVAA